jgi:hypothetical protein
MGQLRPGDILKFKAVEATQGLEAIRLLWRRLTNARDALDATVGTQTC